jgi:hypothetical protein
MLAFFSPPVIDLLYKLRLSVLNMYCPYQSVQKQRTSRTPIYYMNSQMQCQYNICSFIKKADGLAIRFNN